MEFLKEVWDLRKGDGYDKGMFAVMTICILVLLSIPFIVYFDNVEMAAQHCVKTEQTRERSYIQYMHGDKGQIISAYPVHVTEHLYTCDDFARWR